ncbi:BgTH12-04977 [Blumeria graminis f. sp. triticale]|uniref:BgTH12-04977 n=1 Tax=Blumeria graminis f. sp. triticale TaxID=1689686 RepID=A0A9W4GG02_BLUGR|nr:BgTH12-04977 [Blumeria graminis f. sp. triticale]
MKLYLPKLLTLALFLVEPAAAGWGYDCKRHYFESSAVKEAIAEAVRSGAKMVKSRSVFGGSRYLVSLPLVPRSTGVSI